MITKAGVKLLDFGLAKLKGDGASASPMSQMPTQGTGPLTAEGTILGTLQYMAPEQLEGKEADARSDIFAFGAVVYEMLTGKKAFEGQSQVSLMASILEHDPQPIAQLQKMTPATLERLVQVCLAKDPDERWQTARDIHRELVWISRVGGVETASRAPVSVAGRSGKWAWALVAVLTVVALYLSLVQTPSPVGRAQLEIVTPFTDEASSLAISPDGTQVVFVARSEGVSQLWLRSLETGESRSLPGTEGASMPFWSPNSRSIGFFASEQLKRLDLAGGSVQPLTRLLSRGGGSWGDNGEILYAANGGIYSVPASGGERILVLRPEDSPWDYRYPQWLPGNDTFVYWARGSSDADPAALYVSSPDGSSNQRLTTSETGASYIASGHLAFVRGGILYVQAFDAEGQQMVGDPTAIGDVAVNFWAHPAVSASTNGTLIYRATAGEDRQELIRLDRSGNALATLVTDAETPAEPELSPSGDRIAIVSVDAQGAADIWVFDEVLGSSQRMTTDRSDDFWPVWSPDGSLLAFGTARNNLPEIWALASDQSSPPEPLQRDGDTPVDWSPNGEFLLYGVRIAESNNLDLSVMSLEGDQPSRPFLDSRFNESHGQFSLDGAWVAYHSDESGRSEIYVTPFPGPGGVQIISTGGGVQPRWRGDGEVLELFYLRPDNTLMAVELEPSADGSRLIPGDHEELFVTRIAGGAAHPVDFKQFYDVAPDGQSFVMAVTPEDQTTEPITVILNWEEANGQ